ncbi:unnamed protein product, partial [Amoebophrya sp. A25]|eukprot:GSA25T00019449001.1
MIAMPGDMSASSDHLSLGKTLHDEDTGANVPSPKKLSSNDPSAGANPSIDEEKHLQGGADESSRSSKQKVCSKSFSSTSSSSMSYLSAVPQRAAPTSTTRPPEPTTLAEYLEYMTWTSTRSSSSTSAADLFCYR